MFEGRARGHDTELTFGVTWHSEFRVEDAAIVGLNRGRAAEGAASVV